MGQGHSSESQRRKKSRRLHDLEFQELVLRSLINIGLEGSIYSRVSDMVAECKIMIEEEMAETKASASEMSSLCEYWAEHRLDT